MNKPLLTLMMGLPRSGKTTEAQLLMDAARAVIVSPDAIRLAMHGKPFIADAEPFVWATAKTMVKALFIAGHGHVIVDATNMSRKRRDFWVDEMWDRECTYINTPWKVCRDRAGNEPLKSAVDRMDSNREGVTADEKFIRFNIVEHEEKQGEIPDGPHIASDPN